MKTQLLAVAALLVSSAIAGCATAGEGVQASSGDASLTRTVQAGIDAVSYLRADHVRVQTVHHVVYIRGIVDTYPQSADAEAIARRAAGDAAVVNLIDVANAGG